jgi:hypothetical protein
MFAIPFSENGFEDDISATGDFFMTVLDIVLTGTRAGREGGK